MPEASSRYCLVAEGLRKRYGRVIALDGLDLKVRRGAITGLIGPNGAGKTTLFGVVGGLIARDAGTVDLFGSGPFVPSLHAGRVALLPQDAELAPHATVAELLSCFARLQGMSAPQAQREVRRVLELVALCDRGSSRVRQLSHGMRRRVAVAQAFLGEPELVLLDEPVSGLDPELVVHMRHVFANERGRRSLVISSHNLAELEMLCDEVVFIDAGRVVRSGPIEEVTGELATVSYELEESVEVVVPDFETSWDRGTLVVRAGAGAKVADVNRVVLPLLLAAGARVLGVRRGRSLEAAYLSDRGRGP
jgi:ABC-type multidrug transport system ATPase subunit